MFKIGVQREIFYSIIKKKNKILLDKFIFCTLMIHCLSLLKTYFVIFSVKQETGDSKTDTRREAYK